MTLINKLRDGTAVIGVVGLGYVGLPLVLAYTQREFRVIGFDVDEGKLKILREGRSYIDHIPESPIREALANRRLTVTSDFSLVSKVDAVVMCVPTPLDKHFEPDLSYVIGTTESIVPHLRKGQVLSLESTTYPGTTEEEIRPRVEAQGLTVGQDFYLVYSPEREDPGNSEFASVNIPKVLGGTTPECAANGKALYEAVFSRVVPVGSTQVAEFSKLLENIYRAVNIGLVNELKIAADRMGIDIWEVIEAASTKPFGFTPFYPGPGLGGHCIPIDPFYLTWRAREYGVHTRFIELAGEINQGMPEYVVQRTVRALNDHKKAVRESRILLMGLAYKANVDDMRESPAFELMDLLSEMGGEIDYYDPHIPEITPTREHAKWTGHESIEWQESRIRGYDVVIIATHHRVFNLSELAEWANLIIDTRNAMRDISVRLNQVMKA